MMLERTTHVHLAGCVGLQEAVQHHLVQRRLQVGPVYECAVLCRVQAAQLLVLQLQACSRQASSTRRRGWLDARSSLCHVSSCRCCYPPAALSLYSLFSSVSSRTLTMCRRALRMSARSMKPR